MIPADAELTSRHDEITAWDDMPDELKPVLARQMEVYAGFLEHTDHHVGRLVDAIEDLGVLDDTIIYYIIGDNGASAEGTMNGAFNEMANFNGMAALETPEFLLGKMDELGSPESYNHYSVGWAWAMNTPLQWTKQVASHWGGTRNGTIVHWPNGHHRSAVGCARSSHTSSTLPPRSWRPPGFLSRPWSTACCSRRWRAPPCCTSFNEAEAPERHDLQYFEMFGNRGIYHRGWSAVTKHKTPWIMVGGDMPAFDDDVWELYDGNSDFSQAHNLAADNPDMLAKLQRLWLIEATKYNVLPLDDRIAERLNPELAGRPTLIRGNSQLFFPGMGRLSENSVVSIKNKSFSVTANVDVPDRRCGGCAHRPGRPLRRLGLLRQGRQGQVRLQRAGHPRVHHRGRVRRSRPATTRCEWSSPMTAAASPRAATSRSTTTATRSETGRVEATQPMVFSADETTDIGYESGTTVTPDYTAATSRFTGKLHWVQLDVGIDDNDHYIDPEERLRIAMARQ